MAEYSVIGKSIPRVDVRNKATGEAVYCADYHMPGMLTGRIKRSPHPFAKVLSVDVIEARKLPGVKAAISAANVIQSNYGPIIPDQIPLASEYVRYVGDEVAAVAAIDEDTAEEALDLIKVEYEELKPVLTVQEAMTPGASAVHPERDAIKQNIAYHIEFERGEGEAAFNQADLIIEDRFTTQSQCHAPIETQTCMASWDINGKLTFWATIQTPFALRRLLSMALCVPQSKIRVIQTTVGGGFGGKGSPPPSHLACALLARTTGKPVKIALTREEDIYSIRPRLSEILNVRLGFKKDGTMIAKDSVIIAEAGAALGICPGVLSTSAIRPDCVYRLPNIKFRGDLVYTNTIPRGAFRGFGNPKPTFAMESMIDMAADKLGIDPMEIRLKNCTQKGDITQHGWIIRSCGLGESIRKSAEVSDWKKKRNPVDIQGKKLGIGMASTTHVCGRRQNPLYEGSAAVITIDLTGKVKLASGECEIGQGSSTIFAQIAAEELGVEIADIEVVPIDTDSSPYGQGTFGDRVTVLAGHAVRKAAIDTRKHLLNFTAEKLGVSIDDLEMKLGKIYCKTEPEKAATIQEVVDFATWKQSGLSIIGRGKHLAPDSVIIPGKNEYGNQSTAFAFGTQVAEVLVDPETGKVDILNYWAVHDSGTILNPLTSEGQIEGGVVQGIGYALTETYLWDKGKITNANLTEYKLPVSPDIPKIYPIFIDTKDPETPYGAKGLGEPVMNPTAPAIANAIFNAVGVRITNLPITPEEVLNALKKKRESTENV